MQNVSLDTTPLKLTQQINKRTSHNPDEIQKAKDFLKMFESSSNEPSIQQIKQAAYKSARLVGKLDKYNTPFRQRNAILFPNLRNRQYVSSSSQENY